MRRRIHRELRDPDSNSDSSSELRESRAIYNGPDFQGTRSAAASDDASHMRVKLT